MIKYTKSFLKKLNKENIIGKFFEEAKIVAILKQEAERHFNHNISNGEAYELLKQLENESIIITKEKRTIGVIADCKIEHRFKVYGINANAIKDTVKNAPVVFLNKDAISLPEKDIPIRLYIRSSYLCDKLSINEWNALFSRYENDSQAKIAQLYDKENEQDCFIIETTLFNVLSKGAILDLKFLVAAKICYKWIDECLH